MKCVLCSKPAHSGPCYTPADFGKDDMETRRKDEYMNGMDKPIKQIAPPTPDTDGFKTILIRKDDLRFLYECALAYARSHRRGETFVQPDPKIEEQIKAITYRLV